MQILKDDKFLLKLKIVVRFIAIHSPNNARKFKKELDNKIKSLTHFPYKYRQSIHFNNENIRDLIFKGYIIPYFIDEEWDRIIILGIIKYQNKID